LRYTTTIKGVTKSTPELAHGTQHLFDDAEDPALDSDRLAGHGGGKVPKLLGAS
jgi:hypothetical protein